MTKIAKQLTELIGNTPLLELNKYSQAKGLETPVHSSSGAQQVFTGKGS